MTKRIEIVLTSHGPELKTPHSFALQPKQPPHLQPSPSKPAPVQVTRAPSSPLLSFKSPAGLRRTSPQASPRGQLSPSKGVGKKVVGSLLGEIRAATSSALHSVQTFHSKKSWERQESPDWSSSPVSKREGEDCFLEDRLHRRPEDKHLQKAPTKRDLNGFMRNSLIFGPKSTLGKTARSPLKRAATALSESQPYLNFGSMSNHYATEQTALRSSQPSLPAEQNSDNPAPSPEVSKRHAPEVATPTRASFKAKLLAKAMHRAKV